ncbi:TnsA endonuclease N-terminal domain-containing protein [Bacillus sp. 1P02SD]|uniref:TnsA endonuclease N-terminal domain-containing protein n=1 Tax=Bacillus sp. 1P02SD TaxID=3132264 RepID=UPI0039A17635
MAKRKRETNQDQISRWIKEGRGKGEGSNYKPWLTIHDVPSKGMVTRSKGWKTERIHHVLSDLELHYFFTLEWSDSVIDIREQYPLLPIERTLEIAEFLGVKHPTDPKSNEFVVMTTDFFITVKTEKGIGYKARQIKPASNLKKREGEKFAIEQQFYKELGIDWGIVTDKDFSEIFIKNMDLIYNAKYLSYSGLNEKIVHRIAPTLFNEISTSKEPLSMVALQCDEKFGFELGTCLFIVKYLIANKYWLADMEQEINPTKKVNLSINNRSQLYKGKEMFG